MSEVIPEGWNTNCLSDVCNLAIGGTPSRATSEYWDRSKSTGQPWVSIRDLSSRLISETSEYITEEGIRNSNVKLVKKDTVLMSFKLSVGRVAVAGRDLYTNEAIAAFIPKTPEKLDNYFLYHGLQHWNLLENIDQAVKGVTLNKEKLGLIEALLPPLPEQQKIATILSSVDDVIEKTRAQIEKLKDLKTGMMQELLTQGIGHTEFKDSPIGKIPKTWSMIKVQELLADTKYALRSGPFGSALLKSELVNSGIPLLGIDNVHVEELRSVFKRYVSNEKFQELRKYRVFPNDVMVTIMGTVGRCCVVPEDFGIALSSKHVWTLSLDKEKYFPELLCWQINFSDWVKKQFLNESQGGVMESISSSTLKSLMVPVPPIEEQKKIVDVHKILSKRIMRKSDQLRTLIDLKKALMQDLLTGKVRVKVDSPETVAA